ncbi:histamine H2 receptor-like [Lytechinus variegatus]|uniref:histamine H2 receptor-like n=1 Tax=Lytechinus variegatus TaxID=7654 RepID=UPI001BB13242|nr:histamine H2 receptor-like [Lytechinus variegatus]
MENSTLDRGIYPFAFVIFMDSLGLTLSVSLNVLHFLVLARTVSLFSMNLRLCLKALALSDILGGLLCYGMEFIVYFKREIVTSNVHGCNMATAFCTIFVGFSQFILFVITIDRYIAVTRPLQYFNTLPRRRIRILLLTAFVGGVFTGIGRSVHGTVIDYCDFTTSNKLFTQPIMVIYHIVPISLVMITTFLNARLLSIARAHAKRNKTTHQSNDTTHDPEQHSFSERFKSAITISAVVGASYLVWLPYLTITIMCVALNSDLSFVGKAVMYWLLYATFWLNPIVIGVVSEKYRNAVRIAIKGRALSPSNSSTNSGICRFRHPSREHVVEAHDKK